MSIQNVIRPGQPWHHKNSITGEFDIFEPFPLQLFALQHSTLCQLLTLSRTLSFDFRGSVTITPYPPTLTPLFMFRSCWWPFYLHFLFLLSLPLPHFNPSYTLSRCFCPSFCSCFSSLYLSTLPHPLPTFSCAFKDFVSNTISLSLTIPSTLFAVTVQHTDHELIILLIFYMGTYFSSHVSVSRNTVPPGEQFPLTSSLSARWMTVAESKHK